ncbi:MAG: pantoate--beta-alanine ligase [Bacteroidales bacterium]|nr:pantoate--beta-alanine ligase [Bacteroidales bacterium]
MFIFKTIDATKAYLAPFINKNSQIGFVPTMGALHQGHIELIKKARAENQIVVCSIFVNPIQFNNPEDYTKYPITIEADLKKLFDAGCDVVFNPDAKEMYPSPDLTQFQFGGLELVMEGAFRPGHFNGVAVVVKKLLEIVQPQKAYFGEKDYQQLLIVKQLVKQTGLPVDIVPCQIVREADGLAMSSRNMRLNDQQRSVAPIIFQTLNKAASFKESKSILEIKQWVKDQIEEHQMELEYFEVADANTLQPTEKILPGNTYRAFIAVYHGPVRLIDNIPF